MVAIKYGLSAFLPRISSEWNHFAKPFWSLTFWSLPYIITSTLSCVGALLSAKSISNGVCETLGLRKNMFIVVWVRVPEQLDLPKGGVLLLALPKDGVFLLSLHSLSDSLNAQSIGPSSARGMAGRGIGGGLVEAEGMWPGWSTVWWWTACGEPPPGDGAAWERDVVGDFSRSRVPFRPCGVYGGRDGAQIWAFWAGRTHTKLGRKNLVNRQFVLGSTKKNDRWKISENVNPNPRQRSDRGATQLAVVASCWALSRALVGGP